MSYADWIFALHLLTAATLVGGFVMSWIVVVALRTANTPDATLSLNRVARVGTVVIVVGLLGTIALGIWTAILRPELHPWHGWAIAAIVPLGDRGRGGAQIVRRVREAGREGEGADRVGPHRPQR